MDASRLVAQDVVPKGEEVVVTSGPAGASLSPARSALAKPGAHRPRLRTDDDVPPGEAPQYAARRTRGRPAYDAERTDDVLPSPGRIDRHGNRRRLPPPGTPRLSMREARLPPTKPRDRAVAGRRQLDPHRAGSPRVTCSDALSTSTATRRTRRTSGTQQTKSATAHGTQGSQFGPAQRHAERGERPAEPGAPGPAGSSDWWRRHGLHGFAHGVGRGPAGGLERRSEQHAVGKHRTGQRLHVTGDDERATFQRGADTGGARAARARPGGSRRAATGP